MKHFSLYVFQRIQKVRRSKEVPEVKSKRLSGKAKGKSVGKVVHHLKMLVINDLSAKIIDNIVGKHVAKDSVVITDNSPSHNNFADYFTEHIAVILLVVSVY